MTAIPADRLRGVVALIGAGEITPCARRLLMRLADEYDPPRPRSSHCTHWVDYGERCCECDAVFPTIEAARLSGCQPTNGDAA